MSFKRLSELSEKTQNKEILELIEIKTDHDMDKVIRKLDAMEKNWDNRFNSLIREITTIKWYITVIALVVAFAAIS